LPTSLLTERLRSVGRSGQLLSNYTFLSVTTFDQEVRNEVPELPYDWAEVVSLKTGPNCTVNSAWAHNFKCIFVAVYSM
jgi:hypothetical protein